MGYRGKGEVPASGVVQMAYTGRDWVPPAPPHTGRNRQLAWPPVPKSEIERICGKTHISLYAQREAEREYDAFLRGEDYEFTMPEVDADGYIVCISGP